MRRERRNINNMGALINTRAGVTDINNSFNEDYKELNAEYADPYLSHNVTTQAIKDLSVIQIDKNIQNHLHLGKVKATAKVRDFLDNKLPESLNHLYGTDRNTREWIESRANSAWEVYSNKPVSFWLEENETVKLLKEDQKSFAPGTEGFNNYNTHIYSAKVDAAIEQDILQDVNTWELLSDWEVDRHLENLSHIRANPEQIRDYRKTVLASYPDLPGATGYGFAVLDEISRRLEDIPDKDISKREKGLFSYILSSDRSMAGEALRLMFEAKNTPESLLNLRAEEKADAKNRYSKKFLGTIDAPFNDLDSEINTAIIYNPKMVNYWRFKETMASGAKNLMNYELLLHNSTAKHYLIKSGHTDPTKATNEYIDKVLVDRQYFSTPRGAISISNSSFKKTSGNEYFSAFLSSVFGISGEGGSSDFGQRGFRTVEGFYEATLSIGDEADEANTLMSNFLDGFLLADSVDPFRFVFSNAAGVAAIHGNPFRQTIGDLGWNVYIGPNKTFKGLLEDTYGPSMPIREGGPVADMSHRLATQALLDTAQFEEAPNDKFHITVLGTGSRGTPFYLRHEDSTDKDGNTIKGAIMRFSFEDISRQASQYDIERRIVSGWTRWGSLPRRILKSVDNSRLFPGGPGLFFKGLAKRINNFGRALLGRFPGAIPEDLNPLLYYIDTTVAGEQKTAHYITVHIYEALQAHALDKTRNDKELFRLAEAYTENMRGANLQQAPGKPYKVWKKSQEELLEEVMKEVDALGTKRTVKYNNPNWLKMKAKYATPEPVDE